MYADDTAIYYNLEELNANCVEAEITNELQDFNSIPCKRSCSYTIGLLQPCLHHSHLPVNVITCSNISFVTIFFLTYVTYVVT